jgi:hypothetical protein
MSQGVQIQYCDPQGNALKLLSQYVAWQYAAVTLNSASGTTPQTVLTVPAGKYCFIVGIQITTDPIATISAAGMLNTTLSTVTGGETIALLRGYFPSTPATPAQPTVNRQTSAPGAFFGTSKAGDTIQCANSVALTAGSIRVSFNYGFSNVPIGN